MSRIDIQTLSRRADLADAFEVRREVFQIGQGVSASRDYDGLDETADHFVVYENDRPVGTARVRYLNDGVAKIERVAILGKFRGKGYGFELMEYITAHLRIKGADSITLESQEHAVPFYEKLGYVREGEVFEDAGIPHVKMSLKF